MLKVAVIWYWVAIAAESRKQAAGSREYWCGFPGSPKHYLMVVKVLRGGFSPPDLGNQCPYYKPVKTNEMNFSTVSH